MPHAYIVLNPVAGTQDPKKLRELIEQHFDALHWSYEIYTTTGEESVADVVHEALQQEPDLCVAAGGDGTVSGVASGLVHSQVPCGIVPSGTANALARELQIPVQLPLAVKLITDDHALRWFDALQVEDRFFFLNLSIGVSAQVMLDSEREGKRKFGFLAYVWTTAKELMGFQQHRFELDIDGRHAQFRASDIIVANTATLGLPSMRIAPDIHFDDGRLTVGIVRARAFWDYLGIAWDMVLGRQRRDPHLRFTEAQHSISILANEAVPVQADGEIIGRQSVSVSLVPKAVQIIAPLSN